MKTTYFSRGSTCCLCSLITVAIIFSLGVFFNPAIAAEDSAFERQWQNGEIKLATPYQKRKAVTGLSVPMVPNLPCRASYTRGSDSTGAYIKVKALDSQCRYFTGIYYWNASHQYYCKNPSNCSRDYLRNIPAP